MIKDSVYLVTGGASGLGKATSEKLLLEGANVVICDLQAPPKNDIFKKFADSLLMFKIDVTSEKQVMAALDVTKRKFRKLNGVINCAGVLLHHPVYDFEKEEPHSLQEFTTIVTVNLIGTFNVIRLSIPFLAENAANANNERGVIINTSSIAGHQGWPNGVAYAASKAGIIGMTLSLARELATQNIRVVDIAPGNFYTQEESQKDETLEIPKKVGRPSEFADFVLSVINSPMLNGTSVTLDGAIRV